ASAGAPAGAAEEAALAGAAPDLTASTSAFTTLPFGPEPATEAISIPASLASLRASGEANTRPPSRVTGWAAFKAPSPGAVALTSPPEGEVVGLTGFSAFAPSPLGGEGWGEGAFPSSLLAAM